MPTFDPSDLIGRTFLLPPEENGERHRAKVTRQVVEIIDQDNGERVENIIFVLALIIPAQLVNSLGHPLDITTLEKMVQTFQ